MPRHRGRRNGSSLIAENGELSQVLLLSRDQVSISQCLLYRLPGTLPSEFRPFRLIQLHFLRTCSQDPGVSLSALSQCDVCDVNCELGFYFRFDSVVLHANTIFVVELVLNTKN